MGTSSVPEGVDLGFLLSWAGGIGAAAAALCAAKNCGTRELPYRDLRAALVKSGVYFEG